MKTLSPAGSRFRSLCAGILLSGCVAFSLTGCNMVILLGYLIGGPPSIEPDFDKQTGESLDGKEKFGGKAKTCLVLCYAPKELKWDNEAVDTELAKHIAARLIINKINVVDPNKVNEWIDTNPDWERPAEVGAVFKVNYVVYVDLHEYSLFEERANNLYRGRASGAISVVKMNESKKDGDVIFTKPLTSRFPTSAPVAEDQMPYDRFKKLYLSRLSEEVGMLFYEHFAGDDIPHRLMP